MEQPNYNPGPGKIEDEGGQAAGKPKTKKGKKGPNVTQKTFRLRLNYPREKRIYECFEALEGVSDTRIIIDALDLYFKNQSETLVLERMNDTLGKIQELQESMSYLLKRTEAEGKKKPSQSEYL